MTLPTPGPAFHWTPETWGHALRCRGFGPDVQHLFTTRQLPLPASGEEAGAWAACAAAVGGDVLDIVRVRQVHGRAVHVHDYATHRTRAGRPEADAIVSNVRGSLLVVLVADCAPLIMVDRRTGAAAAVHAGWRGTVAGVARAAIETMGRAFGTRPDDLVAAIGPAIGRCCYEVGEDVVAAFRAAGATDENLEAWFHRNGSGTYLDLWRANRDQLVSAGVPADRVHVSGLCTMTHRPLLHSYRADGPRAGRMAAIVRVP